MQVTTYHASSGQIAYPCLRLTLAFCLSLILAACGAQNGPSIPSSAEIIADDPIPLAEPELMVRVSEDMEVDANTNIDLAADIRIDGLGVMPDRVKWSQLSGPGQVVFSDELSVQTVAWFNTTGVYVLELLAHSNTQSSRDTLIVTVKDNYLNEAPVANAGADRSIDIGGTLNLQGRVEDDGLPFAQLNSTWRKASGGGEVVFAEPSDLNTTVTFSSNGEYTLMLEVSDGELSDTDQIRVVVNAVAIEQPIEEPPVEQPIEESPVEQPIEKPPVEQPIKEPLVEPVQEPVIESTPVNNAVANSGIEWQTVTSADGSKPIARHEAGAVGFNNAMYLFGGRGIRAVSRYDLGANKWSNLSTPGKQLHHFQPVVYKNKIYILGALDGRFPAEDVVEQIQIYNPANNTWATGARLPINRRRGSAGTVVYNNKIYMIGGSTNGHDGGTVNWFDEFDPTTNRWKTLPNAPTPRDHFYAAVVGNRLVAAGGRQTDYPATFDNLVSRVDVYNFVTGKWETNAPNIPLPRAGTTAVAVGSEVIVIGGETALPGAASNRVDAYDVNSRRWRSLKPLKHGRHGGGAAVLGKQLHVASGNTRQGGGAETTSHEMLKLQ